METTLMAAWLNDTFAAFDATILGALHALAECGGFALTPLFEAVSFVGEKGACFFALAFVLMVFKRTRRAGTVMFVAICLGALATNIVLKDLVARPRPFESSALFLDWWRFAGAAPEDGFSFPSGHMTAASAAMAALMLAYRNWKTVLGGSLVMLVMGAARCYLVVHYPTDVLAGLLVGALAAVAAQLLVSFAFRRYGERRFAPSVVPACTFPAFWLVSRMKRAQMIQSSAERRKRAPRSHGRRRKVKGRMWHSSTSGPASSPTRKSARTSTSWNSRPRISRRASSRGSSCT